LREATRVVSWFGARDPDFVRRLSALVADVVVAPSVGEGRPVWEHLLASAGAPTDDARTWCEPVVLREALVDEGRRVLVAAGWDGRARLVAVHPGAARASATWRRHSPHPPWCSSPRTSSRGSRGSRAPTRWSCQPRRSSTPISIACSRPCAGSSARIAARSCLEEVDGYRPARVHLGSQLLRVLGIVRVDHVPSQMGPFSDRE